MIYRSLIGTALQKFKEQVTGLDLDFNQSVPKESKWNGLRKEEKEVFIRDFEIFWFRVQAISSIVDDLLFTCGKLEVIKIFVDDLLSDKKQIDDRASESLMDILTLSRQLYSDFYTLKKVLEEHYKIPINKYSEISYISLFRNDLVTHPSLERATCFPPSSSLSSDARFLSLARIIPGGSGWAFYRNYFKENCDLSNDSELDHLAIRADNKHDFLGLGGWKKCHSNLKVLHRIKAHGLPDVDQSVLALELSTALDQVFKELGEEVEKARTIGILPERSLY